MSLIYCVYMAINLVNFDNVFFLVLFEISCVCVFLIAYCIFVYILVHWISIFELVATFWPFDFEKCSFGRLTISPNYFNCFFFHWHPWQVFFFILSTMEWQIFSIICRPYGESWFSKKKNTHIWYPILGH